MQASVIVQDQMLPEPSTAMLDAGAERIAEEGAGTKNFFGDKIERLLL